LSSSGRNISSFDVFKVNAFSNLAHYIPGGIWDHAGKIIFAKRKFGMSYRMAFRSILSNTIFVILTGFLLFLLSFSHPNNLHVILFFVIGILVIRSLRFLSWYFLFWISIGLSYFFLIKSLSPTTEINIFLIIGAYSISWVVGFLTPLAPSGAGIREAGLLMLLSPIAPKAVIIVSALLFRLVVAGRDIVIFGISRRMMNVDVEEPC